MTMATSLRPSACPSLFRLAPARDGSISRVKLPLGVLTMAGARELAAAARRFGNGVIEITSRANLQIRGIAAADGQVLSQALFDAGFGSASPAADDVSNVMVSPSYGIDSLIDPEPAARAILEALNQRADLQQLSPKFSILLDGGETTAPLEHPNDIWLSALDAQTFALGLAGTLSEAPLALVGRESAADAVVAVMERFLPHLHADAGISRIRHLGASASMLVSGFRAPPAHWRRATPETPAGHIGEAPGFVGARPRLGRMTPDLLEALADLSAEHAEGSLRLTPFQSVLFARPRDPRRLLASLSALGLVTDPEAGHASLLACSGSTGCRSALADSQADAVAALALAGEVRGLHVSGCAKSCASARPMPVTLVAVAPGLYDLYRRDAGAESRFGMKQASALTVAEAARLLRDG